MNRRTRLFCSSLLLPAILIGPPVLLTWRALRQARLDRALIFAVKKRKPDSVVLLLKEGADPNAGEHSGQPVTAWQMFRSLFLRIRHGKQPAQSERDTALTLAFNTTQVPIMGVPRIVQALLDAGANPNCNCRGTNFTHWTPLFFAAQYYPSLVRPLLEKGADVNARDEYGETPLMYADDPAVMRLLLDKGADVNARGRDGQSVLVRFVAYGGIPGGVPPETLRFLLDRGAKVNDGDKEGLTPLMFATTRGETVPVRLLIDRGADVNAQDVDGETALMLAARSGNSDTVRLLLRSHANLNLKDRDGKTAYDWARIGRYRQVAALLKQADAKE